MTDRATIFNIEASVRGASDLAHAVFLLLEKPRTWEPGADLDALTQCASKAAELAAEARQQMYAEMHRGAP